MPTAAIGPLVTTVELTANRDAPLPVVGPSLGTSVAALCSTCVGHLEDRFHAVDWDLPGHGSNTTAPQAGPTIAQLATAVVEAVSVIVVERGRPNEPFEYAGDSMGGAVGLQLMLEYPDLISGSALACTGARIGTAEGWRERAETVREGGTAGVLAGSLERWFAPAAGPPTWPQPKHPRRDP